MNDLHLDGLLELSHLGMNPPDAVQSPGRGFWEFTDNQTDRGPLEIIVWWLEWLMSRLTASVDSQSSHHSSASSRSLWWCSNALSIFPNSIQAFPMHPCRFPKTSFLFGNSFSDHPCTVFSTSSALFRPPFAFPDVNSMLKNIQLGILNNKSAISSSRGSVYLHQCLLDSSAETLQVLLAFGERMKYL